MRSLLPALLILAAACAARKPPASPAAPAGRPSEPSIRGAAFQGIPELAPARFGYDQARLSTEARAVLRANAELLKRSPGWQALVEGHCDERGTIEYNLALGQKRAKAVRDYYLMLGVPGDRVATKSLGEEAPACPEPTEACRAVNRRAETKVRAAGLSKN